MQRTDSFEKTMMLGASLIAQSVKNLPAIQETQVRSLGWEDPLEKGMATHSSTLRIPEEFHGQESLVSYSPWGHRVGYDSGTNTLRENAIL